MKNVQIVGVLNVTPDSYFDGGQFTALDASVEQAQLLLNEGADIIDIGGESTGPGSKNVSVDEELNRVLPVIEAITEQIPEAKISVDTYKAEVAKAAIKQGVHMINDVTAGRGDAAMFSVIAQSTVQYVMMFAKDDSARTSINNVQYDNVIQTIGDFLLKRKRAASGSGVASDHIIIDPGLGHFISSDPKYSFEVIKNIHRIIELVAAPVYVSPSRKSFLAGEENLAPKDRLPSTIVASAIAAKNGANYIRTHDVSAVRRGIEVMQAL